MLLSMGFLLIPCATLAWTSVVLSPDPGPYTVTRWKADWPGCAYEDGVSENRVTVRTENGIPWLRVLYPEGSHGSDAGGTGWRFPFPGAATDPSVAELRYTVLFEPGFDFVRGGKLPGLCGGPKTITGGDRVNGKEGWSARIMWRKDGRGQAYVYHMNQPGKYGDEFDFPEAFRFDPGQPTEIHLRVVMNTPGKRDGRLQVWLSRTGAFDEWLVVDKSDLEWRAVPEIGVDSLLFNTFHGGNDRTWAPSWDCHTRFSGFSWGHE